ncbi:MAG: TlpA family protein disulfide reductase [Bacteroidales bacterium]|nr:TlpA family protein disulfide reductase [Bacteroidales bacterium]
MRKFLFFSIAVLLAITVKAQQQPNRGYIVKVGEMAPNITLHLTDGKTVQLKDLRGKVVVLQFTASWCSVCRKEMPHLEKEIWEPNKNKNFLLIAVDRDEPLATVKKFKKDMHMTYPFALDPGADLFGKFANKQAGVTRNVVIDPSGHIAFLTRLYNRSEFLAMKSKIQELLAK